MPKFDLNGLPLTLPTFSSSLGVTFGNIQTSVSGNIFANGALVANGSATGAGSFNPAAGSLATPTDGSVGSVIPPYQNAAVTQYAAVNSQVFAAPAFANTDPLYSALANPVDSDFSVLGSTTAISLGGNVRATDVATYAQDFTIGGTGLTGTLAVSADYLYNFLLTGFNPGDFVLGQGQTIFTMTLGTNTTTYDMGLFTATSAQMDGADILNPNGLFSQTFNVKAGDTGTFTAQTFSTSEVAPVPEPGTFLLAAVGFLGLFLFRKRFNRAV